LGWGKALALGSGWESVWGSVLALGLGWERATEWELERERVWVWESARG
jgi:hypothetical protein